MKHSRIVAVSLLLVATSVPSAHAQSLFGTRGLGVPVTAVDARAAILGGVGIGLVGFNTSMGNPAELAGTFRRGVTAALQPTSTTVDLAGVKDGTSGTRFPLLMVTYPISPRMVTALGFGGYMDQSWSVVQESTRDIGGNQVGVSDLLRSSGGISQVKFHASYALTPELSIGVGGGLLTGHVERLASRTFDDSLGALGDFEQRLRWRFKAPVGTVGLRYDVGGIARIGVGATIGGEIRALTVGDTIETEDRRYGAPVQVGTGASVRLSDILMLAGGLTWDRVPTVGGGTESRDVIRVGGGIEYEGIRSGQRAYPIRIGGRWGQLPYNLPGEEAGTEWSAGMGLGFRLGNPMDPAAMADIGVERGARSGLTGTAAPQGLSEKMWRFTLSLALFAN